MKALAMIIFSAAMVVGCEAPRVMHANGIVYNEAANMISLGDTRERVMELMGAPKMKSADGGLEYFRYLVVNFKPPQDYTGGTPNFFVKFEDGKVVQYGKLGDFDSTKDPSVNVRLETD